MAWVYNLTVDVAHTYFVGTGQWLVHNCPPNRANRTLEEFQQQSAEVRQQQGIKPGKKNIGIADYDIDGETGTLVAISGTQNRNGFVPFRDETQQTFHTFIPAEGGGFGPVDTEAKILEELSSRFNANSTGRIVLYTDRPACRSCLGVIDQFKERHPNIQVDLIQGNLPLRTRPG